MNTSNYTQDQYWYLGFFGLVGCYELPTVIAYFQGSGSPWVLTSLLWFLWFSHFIPKKKNT